MPHLLSAQVREAVPVPLDALKPAVQQLRGSDGRLSALAAQGLQQAAAAAQQLAALPGPLAPPALREQQERLLAAARQWDPALLQLGSVFDEVRRSHHVLPPLVCGCLSTPLAACASPCHVCCLLLLLILLDPRNFACSCRWAIVSPTSILFAVDCCF